MDNLRTCRLCREPADLVPVGPYVRCRGCGGMFLSDFPAAETNAVFEGDAAARRVADEERARLPFLRRRLDWLAAAGLPPTGARLLEIGCGAGSLLGEAADRGWRVAAVEMSPALAAAARARAPQAEIIVGDVLSAVALPTGCDAVLALDVLEHVVDPVHLVRRCRDALAPGGLLLLQTPNTDSLRRRLQGARWDMLDPAQHLTLYSRRALRRLLAAEGMEIVFLRTISGSGRERGAALRWARAKEWLLDRPGWGNGLAVLARRPVDGGAG